VVVIYLVAEQEAVVRTMISHSRRRCSEASFSSRLRADNAWITNSQRARRATLTCDGRFPRDELLSGNRRVAVSATALLSRGLPFGLEHIMWRSKSDRVSDRIRH
jgi:hypothetical protein